ncbi:MAG: sialidase family protein, partial [Gaiellaceae bacterium]
MRRLSSIALAGAIASFLPSQVLAQALSAVEISRDTVQSSGASQGRTQVEPHIAVDPNNPQIVVAVVQEGRFPDGGAVAVAYATSHDGGQTWVTNDLPLLTVATGGPFDRGTDPAVAFGPDGAVYAESLVFGGPRSGIAVQRSDDGGLTFGPPVLAQDDADASKFNDKDWIAVDTFALSPHSGRVYVAWDQSNNFGQPILLRFSDDRGQTWSPLVIVSSATAGGIGAIPLVQPNGALTVVYEDFTTGDDEVAQTSHDGGVTFGPVVKINSFQGGSLPDIRSGGLPAAAVDAVTGALFAVWEDRRLRSDGLRDIVISRSTDGGSSWSGLARTNPDAPNSRLDHFTPAVAALNGNVHVTYRTRDTSAGLSLFV